VVVGDVLKGVVAVLIAKYAYVYFGITGDEMLAQYFAALFVILGHIYPLYFGFKGGKGIMTGVSTIFVLDWEIAVILLLIFIAVFALTRYVSLGSCISSAMYPVLVYMFHSSEMYFISLAVIVAAIAIFKHRTNIQRLIRGTESKTYFNKR
jgi:glycerol-3-phosphate acyltransferase PlsY